MVGKTVRLRTIATRNRHAQLPHTRLFSSVPYDFACRFAKKAAATTEELDALSELTSRVLPLPQLGQVAAAPKPAPMLVQAVAVKRPPPPQPAPPPPSDCGSPCVIDVDSLTDTSLLEQEAEFDLGGDFIPSFEELAELTWDALAPAIARSPTES